ncbi:MAG: hypothetical protein H6623_02465 [Bdellovibrionaceae bacterium]|nr:hypothetical protein [Pseudobdellovibrionaceae bacterium]
MSKKWSLFFTSTMCFFLLLSYQNCGTEQQGSYSSSQGNFGIPYETRLDQIAYMSCAEQSGIDNDAGMFFTFRLGAYGNSAGIRITDGFYSQTRRAKNQERMQILGDDTGTALSRLQFSVRQQKKLSYMLTNQDTTEGVEEQDFDFVLGDLGSDEMSASLLTLSSGTFMNYWAAGGITRDAQFAGTMVFNGSESQAQDLRNKLTQDWMITLGFSEFTNPRALRTPAAYDTTTDASNSDTTPTDTALGTGLMVKFKQPDPTRWGQTGAPHPTMPKRVLSTIYEVDLASPKKVLASWSCPSSLQLKVVYPEDAANPDPVNAAQQVCPQVEDDHADNTVDQARLALIRRTLPAVDWYVNIAHQCVIPRRYVKGSCYGIDSGTKDARVAEQNLTTVCNPSVQEGSLVCSHFMSICYR